jgi:uncharacterized protein YfiM (DUF2279 family)
MQGIVCGFLLALLGASRTTAQPGKNSPSQPLILRALMQQAVRSPATDSWWSRDKRLHLVASAGTVGFNYHLLHDRWHLQRADARGISVSLTALAGVLKELSDRGKRPPTFSHKDLIADGMGIFIGILLFTR